MRKRGHPLTGVWIETRKRYIATSGGVVTPSRGCGLKLLRHKKNNHKKSHPLTGVWIETGLER